MTTRLLRLPVALATVLALLLTGCSTAEPGTSTPDAPAERAPFAPGSYDEGDLDKDVAALAGWGISTYADPASRQPMVEVTGEPSPLRLLKSQVEVLGSEAASGVGTLGADLDDWFSSVAGTEVRMSVLLAAYLQSDSEMATALGEALTSVDLERPSDAAFPTIALVGFIQEMGASADVVPEPARATAATFVRSGGAGAKCPASSAFIEETLGKIFDGIKVPAIDTENWFVLLQPLGWLLNFFVDVYDAIRKGAKWVVINGFRVLVQPLRDLLAQISVIAAVVQTALTSIHPLTSSWEGPGYPELGVEGGPENRYEATVHVRSTNPLVWPEVLVQCAADSGITLPNPSLAGSEVRWELTPKEPDVARETGSDATLTEEAGGGGRATFRFATSFEPKDWKERGAARGVRTLLTAVIVRKNSQIKEAVDQAVKVALGRLFQFLPKFLADRASDLIRSQIDPLLDKLVVESEYRTSREFGVTRHDKPQETPSPTPTMVSPSPPPPRPQPMWVYVDRPGIPGAVEAGRILQFAACDGIAGTWRGLLRTGGLYDDDGFTVPWADLPARPFRIGNGGIGSTTSRASGTTTVLGQTVPVTYDLRISVDGRTMSVDGVPVQPPVSFRGIPIRKAPKAVCP